jgi:hypothetical protein
MADWMADMKADMSVDCLAATKAEKTADLKAVQWAV